MCTKNQAQNSLRISAHPGGNFEGNLSLTSTMHVIIDCMLRKW